MVWLLHVLDQGVDDGILTGLVTLHDPIEVSRALPRYADPEMQQLLNLSS